MKKICTLLMSGGLFFIVSCTPAAEVVVTEDVTVCTSPRSPMCTRDYRPVCGTKETGTATYSNGCSACADESVIHYVEEACPSE